MNNEVEVPLGVKCPIKPLKICKVVVFDEFSHEGKPKAIKGLSKDVFWIDF
jgi:hypothetical protein